MKLALLSDIHMGVRKNSEIFLQSQIDFLKNQFVPYLKENNIKNIFWLGDLFDNRSSTNTKIMNSLYDFFENDMKDFISYIIVGNHDTYYNSSVQVNSLKFLSNFKHVELIEEIKTIEIESCKITLVPWITDNNEFIKEFRKTSCDVCMGHFNIYGFHFNKFKISDDGFQSKIFGNCKKVFTGHFHIRNSQKIQDTEIIYIGSPYQLTRNDIDENRGFTVLNLPDLSYDFINNKISLKYIKLKYPEKFTKDKIKNNIIDVHVDYNESYNEDKVNKYIAKIEEFQPATIPNLFVETKYDLNGTIDLENYSIGSMLDLMREYVNGLDIGNKEEIYQILINLYNDVKGDNL
jgi:DNA repair exonuclease SbcCD nuclease subunit